MLLPVLYRAAYMGFMFVANLLLANLLAPAGLGVLSLLVLNASLLSLISSIGSDAMTMHALVQHKWSLDYGISFLSRITAIQLLIFVLLQLSVWLFTGRTLLSQSDFSTAWIEALYFLGLVLVEKMMVLYYTTQRSTLYNAILLGTGMGYIGILLVLWAAQILLSIYQFLLLVALYSFLQGILSFLLFFVKEQQIRLQQIDWVQTITILKTSVVVMITNVVQLLAYRVDFWLLKHYHSNYEVGLYAQANKFASLLWLLPNIISMLLIARFSNMKSDELAAVFRIGNILNIVVLFATITITKVLYDFFLLEQYAPGLDAFWLMLPGYLSWGLVIYFGAYFSWKGAFRTNLIASSVCLLIIFILDLALIPDYSLNGAAVGNTFAYTLVLGLYFFMFSRTKSFPLRNILRFSTNDISHIKKWVRS